jgi:sugar/nucleoside kinase (ribokinase family)
VVVDSQFPPASAGRERHPDDPAGEAADRAHTYDLFLAGTVFLDIIFSGMLKPPTRGHEIWTDGMGSSPGGVANLAVAAARLGLHTSLAAAFGQDGYGDFCWKILAEHESIDLSHSKRYHDWHSPVTVSLAFDDDRSMITHGHPPPEDTDTMIEGPPRCRAGFVELGIPQPRWVEVAATRGTLMFGDVGWDPAERWDAGQLRERLAYCHAFVPNAVEAQAFTRTEHPRDALDAMAGWVPLAVVTDGTRGAIGHDATTGECATADSIRVEALDTTGAGDVFLAGLVTGTLRGWPLVQRLRFANLCAALSVRHFGGALAAPGWADIAAWWSDNRDTPGAADAYSFLSEVIPDRAAASVLRATATIGLRSGLDQELRRGDDQ